MSIWAIDIDRERHFDDPSIPYQLIPITFIHENVKKRTIEHYE